jgi:diguanylate cyclase (GGDEF)-like protein
MAILAVMSAFVSWLSIIGTAEHGTIATLWLANGLVLGTMLNYPDRYWPALCITGVVGNLAGSLVTGLPLTVSMSFVICNLIEIVAGLVILNRPGDPVQQFTERKSAVRICSGVLLAPFASCLFAGGVNTLLQHAPFWETCRLWYAAHALGLEIMTPLALALRKAELQTVFSPQRRETSVACLILLAIISAIVFTQTSYPFLFVIFPPLVLTVFLTGFVGMSFGLFILAIITLGFTLDHHGPFMLMNGASTAMRILIAQAFLLTSIIMTLPIAIALAERNRLEQGLIDAQEQLRQLSFTDQLTGLSNRRLFEEFSIREWKRACRDKTSLSVLMIDVDLFKTYNDQYGHQSGDKCLTKVAAAIGSAASRPGDLTARYGGEEFIVVLPGTAKAGCLYLAEHIRRSVESLQLPHASSPFGKVTVSIGTASMMPDANSSISSLIEAADKALYEAKHHGRNNVMHSTIELMQAS